MKSGLTATLINCKEEYMAKEKTADAVAGMLTEYLEKEGYSLYHCEFTKEGRERYLKVFIDKDEGYVGTDDCEKVSRYLSDRLDEADIIKQNYYLIVSSPGLDRELITDGHFRRYTGSDIDISLYKALDGKKTISGVLVSHTDECTVVRTENGELSVPAGQIAKVRLAVKI